MSSPHPPGASSRAPLGPAAGLALLALAAGLVAWRFAGLASDDIYITYRYAWNLAHGQGFAFNPGERVFGVTDPGVALLLGLAHAVTTIAIPTLGTLLTALALGGTAALLAADAAPWGRWPEALAAGAVLVTSPYLWTAQGSGPLVALALLLAAAHLAGAHPLLAGTLAGLAIWCRPDALVGAGLLGLLLWAERRRFPVRYSLATVFVLLLGLAAAWWAFGTVLPNTLAAKRQYAALAPELRTGARIFWGRALDHFGRTAGPLAPALLLLGLAGQVPLLRKAGRVGHLLVLYGAAIALAYTALRVPFFLWYTVPPAAALLAGAAWGGGALLRAALGRRGPLTVGPAAPADGSSASTTGSSRIVLAVFLAAALAVIAVTVFLAFGRWYGNQHLGEWRLPAYRAAGEWIRERSRPGEAIFAEEIGILAYFSERPVEDPIGLVSPRSLPYAALGDLAGAFLARPTDFVVFHTFNQRGGTRPVVARPWFARAYREAVRLDLPHLGGSITVFRRLPGAVLPPARPPRARPAPRPEPSQSTTGGLDGTSPGTPSSTALRRRCPSPRFLAARGMTRCAPALLRTGWDV